MFLAFRQILIILEKEMVNSIIVLLNFLNFYKRAT